MIMILFFYRASQAIRIYYNVKFYLNECLNTIK